MTATDVQPDVRAAVRRDHTGLAPTLPERVLGLRPGPYLLASLLLAVFLGFPGFLLFYLLDTGSVQGAFAANFRGVAPDARWRQVAIVVAWMALAFYALWMARAVRQRVHAAEDTVAPLVPGGVPTYRAAFGGLAAIVPPLLTGLLLAILTYPFTVTALREAAGPWVLAYNLVRTVFVFAIYGAALWAYSTALWGVRSLGQLPLQQRPFREDGMLGLRPIGALALNIAFLYFGWLAILVVIALLNPIYTQLVLVLIALTLLGVVLFVWPLDGVHRQMAAVKREQLAPLRSALLGLADRPPPAQIPSAGTPDLAATLDTLRAVLADWRWGVSLEVVERKVASMPTWPFDTTILRRLGAVVVPILVTLVTTALAALLKRAFT